MSCSVPQGQEELSGTRTRSSSIRWSLPPRPERSTTDANGSPAASRLHAMKSSKATSTPQSSHNFDPITPPSPSLQSPHILKPVIPPSTPTGSSHLFTPVTPAASLTSKSTHNFRPVIINKSQSPRSQHNFRPVIINKSKTSESPHYFKPIIIGDSATPISPHTFTPIKAAHSPSLKSFLNLESNEPEAPNNNAGYSFCLPASAPVQTEPSPEAEPSIPSRPLPFKTRYVPYTPRPYTADEKVTFPNGLDGDNPYPRPYGGGWRNHPYHLHERLTTAQLLVDPYAKPPKAPKPPKKESSHNYYGGRSAAQRESTRYVHRASNGELHEEYEMDDLSSPKVETPDVASEATPEDPPKPFVGTAATILQRVRPDLEITHVKGNDPAGNVYFYEKASCPRFTKHSLRPSKRPFSFRNFLNRRLYGRPGDGTTLLMPNIPFDVKIPGVDDQKETEAKSITKKKEPRSAHVNFLDDEWKAQLKEARAAAKARQNKKARELKKKRKAAKKARGYFYSFRQRLEKKRLARAKKNYEKELEEEARKEKMKAPEPSLPPGDLHDEHQSVDHHDFAFAQDAYEKKRAVAMEEARRGKKKASSLEPVSDYMLTSDNLRHDLLHDYDPAGLDVRATALSALLADPANKKRKDDQHVGKDCSLLPDEVGVWKTSKDEPKEADYAKHEEKRQRKLRAEKILAEQLLKNQDSTPEKPLQPLANKTPRSIAKESLRVTVTPPRIRTPDRYKSYTFEEAEQLVTPKSPEQCQFEADHAATPCSPTPFHLPSVEEEFDVEYEKQIADLSNSFKEFL